MFKARKGGARAADDPRAIQAELGDGKPLERGVRSRMESAFGMDFSQVCTHTDTTAAGLSNRLNARAFTVGKHVAFGAGEYRPGTLIGEALIAHELAHVVQQDGGSASVAPLQTEDSGYNALEEDADFSAVGALVSLWGGAKDALSDIAQNAMPRLRSGLGLQRCNDSNGSSSKKKTPTSIPDGCITGNLTAKTSGTLQGGWSVNDYLSGGLSWGAVSSPKTAGRDGKGYKVQIFGPYSGKENLGVSQTMKHGSSNQAFLDGTAAYLGKTAGSVKNGDVNNEPVLNASNPFASTGWTLKYKDNKVSFADVPRAGAGEKGYIDFATCFHSKGAKCTHKKCCVTWRWTIDFAAGKNVNAATQQSQSCS
jgi:hypothetical protein